MQLRPSARECAEALEMSRSLFDSAVQVLTAYKAVVSKVTLTVCGEHQCDYGSVVNRMQDNRSLEDSPGNTCQTTVIARMVERPFSADNETQTSEPYVCSNCGVDSGDQDRNSGTWGSEVEDEHQTGHGFPADRKLGLTGIEMLSQVCSKEHQTIDAKETFPVSCTDHGDSIAKRNRVRKDRGGKIDGAPEVVPHPSGSSTKRKKVRKPVHTEDLNLQSNTGKRRNPKRNKVMRLKASERNKASGGQANVKRRVGRSQKKTPTKVIEEEKSMGDLVTEMECEKVQVGDIFGNTTQDNEVSGKKTATGLGRYDSNLRRYPHFAVHRQFEVCAICRHNKGNKNWLYLFDHIKEDHLSTAQSHGPSVICAKCDWSTPFNVKSRNKSNVMDITTKYILHCVVEHKESFPLGFYRYHCQEEEGCCYIAYTANDLRDHVGQHGTEPSVVDALYLAKADQKSRFARQEKQRELCGVSLEGKNSYILSFKEFRCMLCDDSIVFPDKTAFNNHVIAEHVQRSAIKQPRKRSCSILGGHIDCPLCKKEFAIRATHSVQFPLMALMRHMIRSHSAKVPFYVETFKCTADGCTYESIQKDRLMTHIKRCHSGDKYREKCHVCGKMVPNFTMTVHVRGHMQAEKLASCACDTCGKEFKNEHFLKKHVFWVHQRQKEEYLCSECCFRCKEKSTFMHHLWREHNKNPENKLIIQCSMCDYKNILKQLVKVHERDAHGQKNFLCGTCGKAYSSCSRLKAHQRVHNEKNLLCPHCDYKARMPEVMRAHVNAYHRNKVYECVCGYTTRFSGNLYNHKKKYCPILKQKRHPANQSQGQGQGHDPIQSQSLDNHPEKSQLEKDTATDMPTIEGFLSTYGQSQVVNSMGHLQSMVLPPGDDHQMYSTGLMIQEQKGTVGLEAGDEHINPEEAEAASNVLIYPLVQGYEQYPYGSQ